MKLSCFYLDLINSVNKVIKGIGSKTINMALEGIKFTAYDNKLTLLATDYDLTIENSINADVKEEGEILVPGKLFSEYIKKFNDGNFEIETINEEIKIKNGDSSANIKCLSLSDFPTITKIGDSDNFEISSNDLKDAISKVAFSVATDETRPILKGCLVEIKNQNMKVVALDGFRMAIVNKKIESATNNYKFIIPARSINEIIKIIENECIIKFNISNKYIMAEIEETFVTVKLIEGEYISYRQIIPNDFTTNIIVDKKTFESSLDKASTLTKAEKNNLVKFEISDKFMVMSSNSEFGESNEKLTIGVKGKDLSVCFNAKYFNDLLRQLDDEFIKINFNTSTSPCVVVPSEGEEYLYLILPVRQIQ